MRWEYTRHGTPVHTMFTYSRAPEGKFSTAKSADRSVPGRWEETGESGRKPGVDAGRTCDTPDGQKAKVGFDPRPCTDKKY